MCIAHALMVTPDALPSSMTDDAPGSGAAPEPASAAPQGPSDFDEDKYLRVFPDIKLAIRNGDYDSGRHHYEKFGRKEGRLDRVDYRHAWPVVDTPGFPQFGIDAAYCGGSGRLLIFGWINDDNAPLSSVGFLSDQRFLGATAAIARCRREDAERKVGPMGRLLGFWALIEGRRTLDAPQAQLVLMTGTERKIIQVAISRVNDEKLRDLALEFLAHTAYFSDKQAEFTLQLNTGLGRALLALNADVVRQFMAAPYSRRFGPQRPAYAASIVVCLHGRAEYLFLQSAFFSVGQDWRDHEFIYVSNSPDLADTLLRQAACCALIYGVSLTLIILSGNAGFAAANNIAVSHARSARILIINPDVFPRDPGWALRHTALVGELPPEQTRIFGVPLYYDDGSLMHGGMYFDLDEAVAVRPEGIEKVDLARVEHFGKGASPHAAHLRASRPVPAVTGAFISVDRAWFEKLDGFSLDYIFGHYEDADLCLRSLAAGQPVWLHDIGFMHMEGKGSLRKLAHEGGMQVNRWHFSGRWAELIRRDMLGKTPPRLAGA